ncbi:hypothetical protein [Sulfobacillus thermosulfidooxidans]|uniref:hypothetical protein n=1 Tax=Sulfobacillus thermosulfidooxidans TaxID=28034 RepID=UPI00096BC18C|nr:hypothetical protein [Sulfobacillus thermosulfidooxidans]OLZ09919.1 hypothetical protein BFX05_13450 [Sulfobacillus thermosulfidooxidans]OLZ15775.1 hypothetical protein BFX06_01590 [Sulfobacillus thermosulfidooxidans]OLZ18377.1 hypothetical protein BFX07_08535 [Sulfobacillus thermosulfidooxidans]
MDLTFIKYFLAFDRVNAIPEGDALFTEEFFHELYQIMKDKESVTHQNILDPYSAETYLIDVIGHEPHWIFRYTSFENCTDPLHGKSFTVFRNPRDMIPTFEALMADVPPEAVQTWTKKELATYIFDMIESTEIEA